MTEERGALIEAMARALCEAQGVRRIDGNEMARARDEVEAALTAITEAGYALVPVEPTDAMLEAGHDLLTEHGCNPLTGDAELCWEAMISASPITTKGSDA